MRCVRCPVCASFEDKVVYNGIKKYKINWMTCYKLRPFVHEYWTSCLSCIAICPFTAFMTSPAWQSSRVGELAYSRMRKFGMQAAT